MKQTENNVPTVYDHRDRCQSLEPTKQGFNSI